VIRYQKRGKPPLYNSPDELLEYFYSYIEDCINDKRVATEEGFTVFCFNGRSVRYKYEAYEEYKDVFSIIYDVLADEVINNTNIDSNTRNLVLKSKFRYTERQEVDLKSDNITIQLVKST